MALALRVLLLVSMAATPCASAQVTAPPGDLSGTWRFELLDSLSAKVTASGRIALHRWSVGTDSITFAPPTISNEQLVALGFAQDTAPLPAPHSYWADARPPGEWVGAVAWDYLVTHRPPAIDTLVTVTRLDGRIYLMIGSPHRFDAGNWIATLTGTNEALDGTCEGAAFVSYSMGRCRLRRLQ